MGKYGILDECVRCGQTIFLEKVGTTDCGFTAHDEFEPMPSNWYFSGELIGNLCPRCAPIFRDIMVNFIGDVEKLPYKLKVYSPYLVVEDKE